mgnify:FL=1
MWAALLKSWWSIARFASTAAESREVLEEAEDGCKISRIMPPSDVGRTGCASDAVVPSGASTVWLGGKAETIELGSAAVCAVVGVGLHGAVSNWWYCLLKGRRLKYCGMKDGRDFAWRFAAVGADMPLVSFLLFLLCLLLVVLMSEVVTEAERMWVDGGCE